MKSKSSKRSHGSIGSKRTQKKMRSVSLKREIPSPSAGPHLSTARKSTEPKRPNFDKQAKQLWKGMNAQPECVRMAYLAAGLEASYIFGKRDSGVPAFVAIGLKADPRYKAKIEKESYRKGVTHAAEVADHYNGSTTHKFQLGDCILAKLNLIGKRRPRRNTRRIK